MKPFDAAIKGAREIGFTVLSITMSLVSPCSSRSCSWAGSSAASSSSSRLRSASRSWLGLHLVDADADAVLAHAEARGPARQEPGLPVSHVRGRLQRHGPRLPRRARCLARVPAGSCCWWCSRHRADRSGRSARSRRASCRSRTPASSWCAPRLRPTFPSRPCSSASARWRRPSSRPRRALPQLQRCGGRLQPEPQSRHDLRAAEVAAERANYAAITDVQNRIAPQTANIPGIRVFPVPLQNLRIGGRAGAAAYQYTLTGIEQEELYAFAPRLIERSR